MHSKRGKRRDENDGKGSGNYRLSSPGQTKEKYPKKKKLRGRKEQHGVLLFDFSGVLCCAHAVKMEMTRKDRPIYL